MPRSTRAVRAIRILPSIAAAALPALGCGAVRGRRGPPDESDFLRDDSQLEPGARPSSVATVAWRVTD
jgi:hypothetical protein